MIDSNGELEETASLRPRGKFEKYAARSKRKRSREKGNSSSEKVFFLATNRQLIEIKTLRSLFAFSALNMAIMASSFFFRLLPAVHLFTVLILNCF